MSENNVNETMNTAANSAENNSEAVNTASGKSNSVGAYAVGGAVLAGVCIGIKKILNAVDARATEKTGMNKEQRKAFKKKEKAEKELKKLKEAEDRFNATVTKCTAILPKPAEPDKGTKEESVKDNPTTEESKPTKVETIKK